MESSAEGSSTIFFGTGGGLDASETTRISFKARSVPPKGKEKKCSGAHDINKEVCNV